MSLDDVKHDPLGKFTRNKYLEFQLHFIVLIFYMWYPNRTSIISDIKKVSGKNAKAVTYGRGIYKVHTTPSDSTAWFYFDI